MDSDPISLLIGFSIKILQRPVVLTRMQTILFRTYLEKGVVVQCRNRAIESYPVLQNLNPLCRCIANVLMKKPVSEVLIVQICH